MRNNNKILMLVRNSVSHDARVLKTANSLQNNEYKVNIIGVVDNKANKKKEILENGVVVDRVSFRSPIYRKLSMFNCVIVISLIVFLFFWGDTLKLINSSEVSVFVLINESLSVYHLMLLIIVYFVYFFIKKALFFYKLYMSYSKLEVNSGVERKSVFLSIIKNIRDIKVNLSKIGTQFLVTYEFTKRVAVFFKQDHYTYIHCHDIYTLPAGLYLKLRYNAILIYDAHEMYEEAVGVVKPLSILYRLVHKFAQNYIDGFITINKSFCDIYLERYPKLPLPTLVMNATVIQQRCKYDGRLHKLAGLPITVKIILFQGGFTSFRGIELVLDSVKHLNDGWCVVFMGWGKYELAIDKEHEKYPEKVIRIPSAPQSELPLWTSGAFVGLIPYEDHGMNHMYCTPNKLWEYPNAGVPIIASPRVELQRIVLGNNIGWIYDEKYNSKELAKFFMLSVRDHEEKVKSCGQFIHDNNWNIYEKNIIKLYNSLNM